MSDRNDPIKKTANTYAMIFGLVGIVCFQLVGTQFFERPPGGGINFARVIWAGIAGGLSSGLGYLIGIAAGRGRK